MAILIDDLGNALETAFKANADIQAVVGKTASASTYAIAYADQETEHLEGVGHCTIRSEGYEHLTKKEASAHTVFTFDCLFMLVDVQGAGGHVARVQKGINNVFINRGRTVLDTHFTDNGSNRIDKGGEVRVVIEVDPVEGAPDPDRPIVRAAVEIEIDHVMPLV